MVMIKSEMKISIDRVWRGIHDTCNWSIWLRATAILVSLFCGAGSLHLFLLLVFVRIFCFRPDFLPAEAEWRTRLAARQWPY